MPGTNPEIIINSAHEASRLKDHSASLDLYRQALAQLPDHPTLACDIAGQLLHLKRTSEAKAVLLAQIARWPDSTPALIQLSHIAAELRDEAEALDWLDAAIARASDDVGLLCSKAHRLMRLGRMIEARTLTADLLKRHPDNFAALIETGHVANACADIHGALDCYTRALACEPDHPTLPCDIAGSLAELGRFKEAEALLLSRVRQPSAAGFAWRQRARIANQRKDHRSSIEFLEVALRLLPDDHGIRLELAQSRAAVQHFDRAEDLLNQIGDGIDRAVLLNMKGQIAAWQGFAERARSFWRAGIDSQPEQADCYISLAHALTDEGAYDEALAVLDQASSASPHQLGCALARADVQFMAGRLQEALETAENLYATHPEAPSILEKAIRFNLAKGDKTRAEILLAGHSSSGANADATFFLRLRAILSFARYRFDEAAEIAREILRRNPCDGEMLVMLANLTFAFGDYAEFHQIRKRVQELNENDPANQTRSHAKNVPFMLHLAHEGYFRPDGGRRVQTGFWKAPRADTSDLLAILDTDNSNISAAISLLVAMQRQDPWESTVETPAARDAHQLIPKTIHQFWDTPDPPKAILAAMTSWPLHCSGYTHRVFNDESARDYLKAHFDPHILKAFEASKKAAARSDLMRVALLYREGGVYADADDVCLSDVSDWFAGDVEFAIAQESAGALLNAFIAARPRAPLVAFVLERIAERVIAKPDESIWYTSGPGLWTLAFCEFYHEELAAKRWPKGVRIIDFHNLGRHVAPFAVKAYKRSDKHWLHKDNGLDTD